MNLRGICLLALTWAGLTATPAGSMDAPLPTTASARVAMNYSCSLVQGVVVLQPGPEVAYNITGTREQRLFTTCDPPFSNNCRSLTLHKFDIACGLGQVPWHRVVAAMGQTPAGEASISNGHLVLARDADGGTGQAPSCKDRKGGATGSSGECLPWSIRKPTERLVLPQGFAPLGEAGARVIDANGPPASVATGAVQPLAQLPGSGPYRITQDLGGEDAFAFVQSSGASAQTVSQDSDSSEGWTTSLSFNTLEDHVPELIVATSSVSGKATAAATPPASIAGSMPWIAFVAMLLACAAGYYVYRTPQLRFAATGVSDAAALARRVVRRAQDQVTDLFETVRSRLADTSNGVSPSHNQQGDPALASALLQLSAMLARTEAAVSTLSSATVVREVMQTELAAIRQRLQDAESSARRGSTPVMKLAAQFRQIARDIDRVQSITQSAAHSTTRPA